MGQKWIWDSEKQELVPYEQRKLAELHQVIANNHDNMRSPVDGLIYTSQSAMERAAARMGFVCAGNESQEHVERNRPQLSSPKEALLAAWEKHSSRK